MSRPDGDVERIRKKLGDKIHFIFTFMFDSPDRRADAPREPAQGASGVSLFVIEIILGERIRKYIVDDFHVVVIT